MTASEQTELKVVVRLAKWAIAVGLVAAFSFGLWVANLQGQVEQIPELKSQLAEAIRAQNRNTSRLDSLITLFSDREKRDTNPLTNR